jgi:hypothetical protein
MDGRRDAVRSIIEMCIPPLSRKKRSPGAQPFYYFSQLQPYLTGSIWQTGWDFNYAIGDTIREKYESLVSELAEMTVCLRGATLQADGPGFDGDGWLCTTPEISSIFETASGGFSPACYSRFKEPGCGVEMVMCGIIRDRWRLFKFEGFPGKDSMLVGLGMPPTPLSIHRVGLIKTENFVI